MKKASRLTEPGIDYAKIEGEQTSTATKTIKQNGKKKLTTRDKVSAGISTTSSKRHALIGTEVFPLLPRKMSELRNFNSESKSFKTS
ncbi:hypothetical protein [Natronorubrum sp. FCH18a]|uniref:hypothetical protein n=1 Tax=Natronorubrum sp. FCH18a TaxID=3447018 RepID=UPI003F517543